MPKVNKTSLRKEEAHLLYGVHAGIYLKITNDTKRTLIASQARVADTFFSRLMGLLGRRSLNTEEALIITYCQSIHMFFMRFPIDVIFVDKNNRVVGLVAAIQPYRLSPIFWKASYAIELKTGAIQASLTGVGDIIRLEE